MPLDSLGRMPMMRWLILHLASEHELRSAAILKQERGFTAYVPVREHVVSHARKQTTVIRPLLTGYGFVRHDVTKPGLSAIRTTPGVLRLLTFGGVLAWLEDDEIDRIRGLEDEHHVIPQARIMVLYRDGELVRIVDGENPFFTQGGPVVSVDSRGAEPMVKVSLDIFRRKVDMVFPQSALAAQ